MSAPALVLTRHADQRLRQRGLRERDVALVLEHGTPTSEAVILTDKDARRAISAQRREIARLRRGGRVRPDGGADVGERIAECRRAIERFERLRGTAVYTREAAVVTVFRPTLRQVRRLCGRGAPPRRARRRGH